MATSGTMLGSNQPNGGQESRYIVNWQLSSQSVPNNTSTINWQAKWRFVLNDRQLDNGNAVINGASRWDNPGRLKDYTGDQSTRDYPLASGTLSITHNPDGTKSFNINGATTGYQNAVSSGSTNFDLPTIVLPPEPEDPDIIGMLLVL